MTREDAEEPVTVTRDCFSCAGEAERFAAGRSPFVVLDPGALADAADLLDSAPGAAADLEVAYLVGMLYWFRRLADGPAAVRMICGQR